MPSIRYTLSSRDKITALYTDPTAWALARSVAEQHFGAAPGTQAHRRNLTHWFQDVEARLHGNRLAADKSFKTPDEWRMRRDLAYQATGYDALLATPGSADAVRKWRETWVPSPIEELAKTDPGRAKALKEAPLPDQLRFAAETYRRGLPPQIVAYRNEFERLTMGFARSLGQFPATPDFNYLDLRSRHLIAADGTYLREHSGVWHYVDEETGETEWLGTEPGTKTPRAQATIQDSGKEHGPGQGVNHAAIITRTPFGRLVLSLERALGGEMHATLRAIDRLAPLAEGAIGGLLCDGALTGWTQDYLFAHHAIISITKPAARRAVADDEAAALDLAAKTAANKAAAADDLTRPLDPSHDDSETKRRRKAVRNRKAKAILSAKARRILGEAYDVAKLVKDVEKKRPLGAGLPLGTSIYLNAHEKVVPVSSRFMKFLTIDHQVNGQTCAHQLYVDDGAIWDTCDGFAERVKTQRLRPVESVAKRDRANGLFRRYDRYELSCPVTGEVLVHKWAHTPSGKWKSRKRRDARHHIQPIARCDARWRVLYGKRNDVESWFSWMKNQMLEDRRAPSLDLNHQFLDVLNAAILTNAYTRMHHRLERS